MRAEFANSLDYWSKGQFALDSKNAGVRKWKGLLVIIETKQYDVRSGEGWMNATPAHYGFIAGTVGADGDEVDCYLGPDLNSNRVYVVDQNRMDDLTEFDEHKCMLGYGSMAAAKRDFLDGHSEGAKIFRGITHATVPLFKLWLRKGEMSIPYAEWRASANYQSGSE